MHTPHTYLPQYSLSTILARMTDKPDPDPDSKPTTVKKTNTKTPKNKKQLSKKRTPDVANGGVKKTNTKRGEKLLESWEYPEIEDGRKRAALGVYRETGNASAACRAARVSRGTWYVWCDYTPGFEEAAKEVYEAWIDRIEREAYRRAVEGVTEPVGWYKGEAGGYIQRYSDPLAMFLLKGNRPEKYADRMELKAALANLDLTRLPDHMVEQIAQGVHPLVVLAQANEAAQKLLAQAENGVESSDSEEPE